MEQREKEAQTPQRDKKLSKHDTKLLVIIAIAAIAVLACFLAVIGRNEQSGRTISLISALKTLLISMIPVVELRGAIPIAVKTYQMSYANAFLISYIGNCLIILPVILLTRTVIEWLKKYIKPLRRLVIGFENHILKKGEKALKYAEIGLLLFVAIPLPGTGAWTGAMIAGLLGIRLKAATPIISIGVLIAGILVMTVTNAADLII